jgi:hypothetical protein
VSMELHSDLTVALWPPKYAGDSQVKAEPRIFPTRGAW